MQIDYEKISVTAATLLQKQLREKLILQPIDTDIKIVGGADISFNRFSPIIYAGIVLLSYPDLQPIGQSTVITKADFPYVPGYLAFREVPALLQAWEQLSRKPDLMVFDGHGIAHPRRLGVASHFGVITDTPAIGCAKKPLFGQYTMPDVTAGSASPIKDKDELLGYAFRTRNKVKPVFISPGHRTDADSALAFMRTCTRAHRLPEPTRLAHNAVNELRAKHQE